MSAKKTFNSRFQYNSPVTLTYALISFIVLLLGGVTNGIVTSMFFSVYQSSWINPFTYIRLFGHVLGHASWSHFSGNMILFLVLGPILEEKYGSKIFINMIMITAIVSGLFYMIFFPFNALLGASGVVFMMIVLSSAAGMKEGKIPITMLLVVVVYIGGEIMNSLKASDDIAQAAHIIGGICGAGFGFIYNNRKIKN
jgi:membrane associated rhomboid family serine protease